MKNIVSDCTAFVSINRPNISTVKKLLDDNSNITQTGLEILLDIMDEKLKEAEQKMALIEEEKKSVNSVEEAIWREFLPKQLVEKALLSIAHGNDEKRAIENCFSSGRYSQNTVCAVRLVNFYESTCNLPADEVILIYLTGCVRLCQHFIVSID